MGNRRHERIPAMDYRQCRRARRLVRECCNYDNGQCIVLDEGDGCVCVQSISHSLLCRWFCVAVLPLDHQLETALYHRLKSNGVLTWNPVERDIKTMRPQSGAGRMLTKRRRKRLPGTVITV